MKLQEIKELFGCVFDVKGCPVETEGNNNFGEILSTSIGCPPGEIITLEDKNIQVTFLQYARHSDWGATSVFQMQDGTCFSITGDSNSWDYTPEYTSPANIKLVQPVEKLLTVFEEVKDES